MAENEKPKNTGSASHGKTAEVTFGEQKYKIHKLKAGNFYKALEVYMEMIKEVAPETEVPGKGEPTVNFDKLVVSMFKSWPKKMIEFIVICCSTVNIKEPLTEKTIKDEAYPEQITEAFRTCLKLNNVAENLKNFVAPIGELGAQIEAKDSK